MVFPGGSAGEESACNAGNPSSVVELGRSPGEGISYPLPYSWASLVAQLVKNPPAMRETWVRSLGWEDPLEEGKATHSNILTEEFPGLYSPWGHKELDTTKQLSLSSHIVSINFFFLEWECLKCLLLAKFRCAMNIMNCSLHNTHSLLGLLHLRTKGSCHFISISHPVRPPALGNHRFLFCFWIFWLFLSCVFLNLLLPRLSQQ